MKVGDIDMTYLADQRDDVLQRVQRGGQGVEHDLDTGLNVPPLPLLCGIIKGEEHRPRVSLVGPLDLGSSAGMVVTIDLDQR